jgi:hypothetical protein
MTLGRPAPKKGGGYRGRQSESEQSEFQKRTKRESKRKSERDGKRKDSLEKDEVRKVPEVLEIKPQSRKCSNPNHDGQEKQSLNKPSKGSAAAPALGPELEPAHGLTTDRWMFHRRS